MFFFFSLSGTAHLEGGEDKEVDSMIVDFGYDPAIPFVDSVTTIAITLFDKETNKVIFPTDGWVRISKDDEHVFVMMMQF